MIVFLILIIIAICFLFFAILKEGQQRDHHQTQLLKQEQLKQRKERGYEGPTYNSAFWRRSERRKKG